MSGTDRAALVLCEVRDMLREVHLASPQRLELAGQPRLRIKAFQATDGALVMLATLHFPHISIPRMYRVTRGETRPMVQ